MLWLKFTQYLENCTVLTRDKKQACTWILNNISQGIIMKLHSQLDILCLRYQRCLRYNRGLRSKLPCISFVGNAVLHICIPSLFIKIKLKPTNNSKN